MRRPPILAAFAALLAAFTTHAADAQGIDGKKALKQADKAVVRGVDTLGAAFKQASKEVDRAAKTGSDTLRRAAKPKGQ